MFLLLRSSQSQRRRPLPLLFIGFTFSLLLLLSVGVKANKEQDDVTRTKDTYLRPARRLFFDDGNCPPNGFRSRPTLSLETYISALWYPQKAAPVLYAMGQSFCSVVKYTLDTSCTFLCGNGDIPRIDVRNRGLAGSITGSLNDACLKAMVPNAKGKPAEIRVGPPQRLYTPANYWVVDAGLYENVVAGNHTFGGFGNNAVYDWAIISGGSPTRESNGACIAGSLGQFDTRGLWIFARDPIPPVGAVQAIDDYAASLGLDTSAMIDVVHEGCTYDFLDPEERPSS